MMEVPSGVLTLVVEGIASGEEMGLASLLEKTPELVRAIEPSAESPLEG